MIYPTNKRITNCADVRNAYNESINDVSDSVDELRDTFEDNYGFKYVYINFDFDNKFKAIIYEGNFAKEKTPYKKMHCYPYENQVYKIGQYITYYDDYKNKITALLETLDNENLDNIKGHLYKCNNMLKWYDENRILHEYPCVYNDSTKNNNFDYGDSMNIIAGICKVTVQYNEFTKLLDENDRFILNGRAMIVTEVHNHIQDNPEDKESVGIVTLDLTKDVTAKDDDLENGIANVDKYNYKIVIEQESFSANVGTTGQITAKCYLNDILCDKELAYTSSDSNLLTIDENGSYQCLSNGNVQIICALKNNPNINACINVTIEDMGNTIDIVLEPLITKIQMGKTQEFKCYKTINGISTQEELSIVDISDMNKGYYEFKDLGFNNSINQFSIKALKQNKKQKVKITISDNGSYSESFEFTLAGIR